MKQHITVEQFDELSKKQKSRLLKWTRTKSFSSGTLIIDDEIYPLFSIGQMIEFLSESEERFVDSNGDVYLEIDSYVNGSMPKILCDDLWERVKEVLL